MLWFLIGIVIAVLAGSILISLLKLVFSIIGWIFSFIFSLFE